MAKSERGMCNKGVTKCVKKTLKILGTPRNIRLVVFVYTGAAEFRLFGMDRDSEQTPRWQPRGLVTRSFSGSWTRKKRCLATRGYSSPACVSTLS
jgi:hypothetical protein